MLRAAATGHPGIGTIHAPDVQAALKNLERMACEAGDVPANVVRGMLTSSAVPLIVVHIGRYGGKRLGPARRNDNKRVLIHELGQLRAHFLTNKGYRLFESQFVNERDEVRLFRTSSNYR